MFCTERLLTELWIMAMATIVNRTDGTRAIHADYVAELLTWKHRSRPRA